MILYAKNRWQTIFTALGKECASVEAALAAASDNGDEAEGDADVPEPDPEAIAALQQQRDAAHATLPDTALYLGALLPFDNPVGDATLAEFDGNMLPGQGVSEAALREENIVVGDEDNDYDEHVDDENDGE